jgi:hypothetical protein
VELLLKVGKSSLVLIIISLVLKYPIQIVYLMLIKSQCNEFICTPIFFAWEKCFTREETLALGFMTWNFAFLFSYSRGEDNLIVAIIPFVMML